MSLFSFSSQVNTSFGEEANVFRQSDCDCPMGFRPGHKAAIIQLGNSSAPALNCEHIEMCFGTEPVLIGCYTWGHW